MRVRVYFYRVVQGAHAVFVRMRTGWGLAVLKCGAQRLTRDTISSRLLVAHLVLLKNALLSSQLT